MGKSDKTPFHFGNPVVNIILTGLAFLFFLWILRPHVPAQTELYRWIFAALPATALTLTFYLCLAMYRVTVNDHRRRHEGKALRAKGKGERGKRKEERVQNLG